MDANLVSVQNNKIVLTVDRAGGAIVDFHLAGEKINPLNFNLPFYTETNEKLYFKGHFLCLGRWGDPSRGEIGSGIIKHGDFIKQHWDTMVNGNNIDMSAFSELEGLSVKRAISTEPDSSCFRVVETVTNKNPLGRLYNMVQHPTISFPFLDQHTIVDCNAEQGFDYAFDDYTDAVTGRWPELITKDAGIINLRNPKQSYSSVFSFAVRDDEYGWMTAWSPSTETLLGYIWKRSDYPWISHWIFWEDGSIRYRGLEFGTTGIHKPFQEMFERNLLYVSGNPTFRYIDANETQQTSYISFITKIKTPFNGVETILNDTDGLLMIEKQTGRKINMAHPFN